MHVPRRPGHGPRRVTGIALGLAALVAATFLSTGAAYAGGIFVRSANPTGEADLVTVGPNNSLDYYWAAPGGIWYNTQVAGPDTTYSAPSVFVRPNGEADIVAEGLHNSLQYYTADPGKPWTHFEIASHGIYSAPSIYVRADGDAYVVAEGPHNSLLYYTATPGKPWKRTQLTGRNTTYSAPSVYVRATDPTDEVDVVAVGPHNALEYYWALPSGKWHHTQVAGDRTTYSAPSVFVRTVDPKGEADIVAEGPDNTLLYYTAMPGMRWSHSTEVAGSGTTYAAPSIFVRAIDPEGQADIVTEGPGNTLLYYFADPGAAWSPLQVAGGGTTYSG
jgi:hypothetical protein